MTTMKMTRMTKKGQCQTPTTRTRTRMTSEGGALMVVQCSCRRDGDALMTGAGTLTRQRRWRRRRWMRRRQRATTRATTTNASEEEDKWRGCRWGTTTRIAGGGVAEEGVVAAV
jgi:hypothetical protein